MKRATAATELESVFSDMEGEKRMNDEKVLWNVTLAGGLVKTIQAERAVVQDGGGLCLYDLPVDRKKVVVALVNSTEWLFAERVSADPD